MPLDKASYTAMPDYAADQAVEQSAIDYAHDVLDQARELAMRVENLADRLCGPTPQDASLGAKTPAQDALLPNLREHARVVRGYLSDGMIAIDRINRAL
jgi:hypothetical protein